MELFFYSLILEKCLSSYGFELGGDIDLQAELAEVSSYSTTKMLPGNMQLFVI